MLFRQESKCVQMCKCIKKKKPGQKGAVSVDVRSFIRPAVECFCTPRYSFGRFVVAQLIYS